ncbi:MAG: DUF4398 domain-containing protein [Thiohalomonadaceae bacterium]
MVTRKILYAAAALSLAACGGPDVARPSNELNMAAQAMERARQANAYEFASFEMTAADRKLQRARDLAASDEDDDRIEARRLAEQVTVDARLAEAKARLARSEKVESEMSEAVDALRNGRGGVR